MAEGCQRVHRDHAALRIAKLHNPVDERLVLAEGSHKLDDGGRSEGGGAEGLVSTLTADHGVVAASLMEVRQGQGRTDLAGGLRLARRLLAGKGGEVIVYNDEAGPTAVPAAREEISLLSAQGGSLRPRPLSVARPANVTVLMATYGDGPEGGSVRMEVLRLI